MKALLKLSGFVMLVTVVNIVTMLVSNSQPFASYCRSHHPVRPHASDSDHSRSFVD